MRSLLIDRNDSRSLRSGPQGKAEFPHDNLFGLASPFFFSHEGACYPLCGVSRNATAFLIASGPSLWALDLSKAGSVWTMTLNNGPATFRPNANCTVDEPGRFSFSTWLDPRITKFMPMAHFEKALWDNRRLLVDGEWVQKWEPAKLRVGDCPNVIGFRRNEKFHAPRWLHEDTINWGNHAKFGGGRSVMLAAIRILYLLGFRRVYLVGVDFEMTPEKKYHFPEERTAAAIRGNMTTYAKLQQWFTELQPHFLKAGFVVKNCNPHSKLTAFPFLPYAEAIAEATAHLGDYRNERTTGMYRKREDKLAEIGQSPNGEPTKSSGASSEPAAQELEPTKEAQ